MKWFEPIKGYGFISRPDVFYTESVGGARISYEVVATGKISAENLRVD
jgi:cold shock CspA family protein